MFDHGKFTGWNDLNYVIFVNIGEIDKLNQKLLGQNLEVFNFIGF